MYAVKSGHKTGIFEDWNECAAAVKGFPNAEYKGFNSIKEAEAYLDGRDLWNDTVKADNDKGYLVAFTDGSFNKELKRYSFGVVFILPDGSEAQISGYSGNENYIDSESIAGEIFGVINALDWAVLNGYEKVKIYHDYEGLSKWISGEWKAISDVSKMFIKLYKRKFEDFLEVEFSKVSGHSNVSYNEKADELANCALTERKKAAIQGENWYSVSYFNADDFNTLVELIKESDVNIDCNIEDKNNKKIYRFTLDSNTVTVTLYTTGKHKLLVQGKPTYLFQFITSIIIELDENCKIEEVLGSAYKMSMDLNNVNEVYEPIEKGLPHDYPDGIKRLIRQSVINLKYYLEAEDYSQYVIPALRALEGHLKYLITNATGTKVIRRFTAFNKDNSGGYVFTGKVKEKAKKKSIEICYNYYKSQRDTLVHYGDVMGSIDNTRFIDTKEEADEIIQKCLDLITSQV